MPGTEKPAVVVEVIAMLIDSIRQKNVPSDGLADLAINLGAL